MDLLNQLYQALRESDPADLPMIRNYIAWVRVRRQVHHFFYLRAHWVQRPQSPARAHWL